jgi:acetate---CoA ligase (ADP-forming)
MTHSGQSELAAANHKAVRELVTLERLREFFTPQSIAMVGASENSGWATALVGAAATMGFTGRIVPVHPRVDTAFGRKVIRSLRDLDEPVDTTFILVGQGAVESVLDDMAAAGIRNGVVVTAGYREMGAPGRAAEESMVAKAAAHGILLLGPNCLGFFNVHSKSPAYGVPIAPPLIPGPVGVALQSGALALIAQTIAKSQGVGLSLVATMGNEPMIDITDAIDYMVEDENTKVICLFLEEVTDRATFARAAQRADAAGKPIVALKVGATELGQAAAMAHTGSATGNDAVADAAFRQLNIIRVKGMEEMFATAGVLAYNTFPKGRVGRRLGVVTGSGGGCDIISDSADPEGLEIPEFTQKSVDAIIPLLPDFANVRNPLDVTGFAMASRSGETLNAMDKTLDIVIEDPNIDLVLYAGINAPPTAPLPDNPLAQGFEPRLAWVAERMKTARIPVVPISMMAVDQGAWGMEKLLEHGIYVAPGLNGSVAAVGRALRWLDARGSLNLTPEVPAATRQVTEKGAWSEMRSRQLLEEAGVPIVPGELVNSADEAAAAATRLGFPVVLKIQSEQITHKSDIGGVALRLNNEADVRTAFEKVYAAGKAVQGAVIDGVLVAPMRSGGLELLVGITKDPTFGPVMAVGMGGVWVEIMQDTSLRVLPVDAAEVKKAFNELKAAPLLKGARGSLPVDLDALAEAVTKLGDVAVSLGDSLGALEVNPLWVNGSQIEALDVLVITE